ELMLFDTAVQTSELNAERGEVAGKILDLKRQQDTIRVLTPDVTSGSGTGKPAMGMGPGGFGGGAGPPPGLSAPLVKEPAKEEAQKLDKLSDETKYRNGRGGEGKPGDKNPDGFTAGTEFFFEDGRQSGLVRQLYRKLDPTMEWAENNYYNLRIAEQHASLISVGPFWVDYAKHNDQGPFLSRHLADASRNFTEMMFALSVTDLPFEPAKHLV